jgi:transcriptional regulator with XRE-family HTH domain
MKTLTSERIKEARIKHDLTQEGLGYLLNLSKQTISNYESGQRHPGAKYIRKIAVAFKIDVNYLMGIKDNMEDLEKENSLEEISKTLIEIQELIIKHYLPKKIERVEKICSCCGKPFFPEGRVDTKYCNGTAPNSSKKCSEVGAIKSYRNKVNNNPIKKEFQKIYKKIFAQVRLHKITREQFNNWSWKSRKLRERALNENWNIIVFTKRLQNIII